MYVVGDVAAKRPSGELVQDAIGIDHRLFRLDLEALRGDAFQNALVTAVLDAVVKFRDAITPGGTP